MMPEHKWIYRTENALFGLIAVCAGIFIAFYGFIAWYTVDYPYFLSWSDGSFVVPVQRILEGYPVYSRPSLEYVPNLYTPLYFYASAAVSLLTERPLQAGRLVSFLCTLGIGALTYIWILRECKNRLLALGTTGLFFATFKVCGSWYTAGRVDCLFFLLLLSGFYVSHFFDTAKSSILAGLLFTLSFFTKQSALIAVLPVLAAGMLIDRKRWATISFWFICPSLCLSLLFNYWSDGWFAFFVITMPADHLFSHKAIYGFWTDDLWLKMWPCCLLTILAIFLNFKKDWKEGLFLLSLSSSCIVASYVSRLHSGGYTNVLIPVYYILILSSAIAIIRMRAWAFASSAPKRKLAVYFLSILLLTAQYELFYYDPQSAIPNARSLKHGQQFTEYLRHVDGDVLITKLPFLQTFVGKKSYGWGTAGWDVMRMLHASQVKEDFINDINASLQKGKFSTVIIVESELAYTLMTSLHGVYCYKEDLPGVGGYLGETPVKVFTKCAAK